MAGRLTHNNEDEMYSGVMNSKTPPGWSPETNKKYGFRSWVADLALWSAATELPPERQGPAVALRVGGSAHDLMREVDPQTLVHGTLDQDPATGAQVQLSGVDYIVRSLRRRFAPLEQEVQLASLDDVFRFRRKAAESVDELLARFELLRYKAEQNGRLAMSEAGWAWLLLSAMHVPSAKWDVVLLPTRGNLPTTPAEYREMTIYLRRVGHLNGESGDKDSNAHQHRSHFVQSADAESQLLFFSDGLPAPAGIFIVGGDASTFDDDDMSESSSDEEFEISPENFPELNIMNVNDAGEHIYLEYRRTATKWKKWKRIGAGTAGGKSKYRKGYKSKTTSTKRFLGTPSSSFPRRRNPIGADGKVMRCSLCQSEEHFRAKCPKNSRRDAAHHALLVETALREATTAPSPSIPETLPPKFFAGLSGQDLGRQKHPPPPPAWAPTLPPDIEFASKDESRIFMSATDNEGSNVLAYSFFSEKTYLNASSIDVGSRPLPTVSRLMQDDNRALYEAPSRAPTFFESLPQTKISSSSAVPPRKFLKLHRDDDYETEAPSLSESFLELHKDNDFVTQAPPEEQEDVSALRSDAKPFDPWMHGDPWQQPAAKDKEMTWKKATEAADCAAACAEPTHPATAAMPPPVASRTTSSRMPSSRRQALRPSEAAAMARAVTLRAGIRPLPARTCGSLRAPV